MYVIIRCISTHYIANSSKRKLYKRSILDYRVHDSNNYRKYESMITSMEMFKTIPIYVQNMLEQTNKFSYLAMDIIDAHSRWKSPRNCC